MMTVMMRSLSRGHTSTREFEFLFGIDAERGDVSKDRTAWERRCLARKKLSEGRLETMSTFKFKKRRPTAKETNQRGPKQDEEDGR